MRLTTIAALVAMTTFAATGEAQARHRRNYAVQTAIAYVEQPAEEPSLFDRLVGRVEAPVRRLNSRLNALTGQQTGSVQAIVTQEAAAAGVPHRLAHAVIKTESGYNCRARNASGAAGAGQLMPATARSLGVRNVYDCRQNIAGAMRYLRQAINRGGAGCAGVSLYETGVGARPHCSAYGRRVMRLASL